VSWLPFELGLALRYLRPKRTSVSFITLISVIGVMLGVAVLIVVMSVMTGFHQKLQEKLFGFRSDLMVESKRGPFEYGADLNRTLHEVSGVSGVSPVVMSKVMVQRVEALGETNGTGEPAQLLRVDVLPLIGVDPATLKDVTVIPESLVEGRMEFGDVFLDERFAVVGINLTSKKSLELELNSTVSIYSTGQLQQMKQARDEGDEFGILPTDFRVKGVFNVGFHEFNNYVLCSTEAAQELFEIHGKVTAVMVKLHDPGKVDEARDAMQAALGRDFMVMTWRDFSPSLVEAVAVEKAVIEFLLFFIVIVAAFGITSSLIIFGVQKTRDIGLMKALGATNSQVSVVFLAQSFVVGALGVLMGLTLGLLVVEYRNDILRFMREKFGLELFPANIYHFYELPALIVSTDLMVICGGTLVISLMAGLVPARNAARLKPAEALRHE